MRENKYGDSSVVCRILFLQTLRGNATDVCETRDPCQHGGICISTDSGPICECRNPDYEGEYCEKGSKIKRSPKLDKNGAHAKRQFLNCKKFIKRTILRGSSGLDGLGTGSALLFFGRAGGNRRCRKISNFNWATQKKILNIFFF